MARLDTILRALAAEDADGLRMLPGVAPELIFGDTAGAMDLPPFTERQLRDFVRELTTQGDLTRLHSEGVLTLHYEYGGLFYACTIQSGEGGSFVVEFRAERAEALTHSVRRQAAVRSAGLEPADEVPITLGEDDFSFGASHFGVEGDPAPKFQALPVNAEALKEVGQRPGFLDELVERERVPSRPSMGLGAGPESAPSPPLPLSGAVRGSTTPALSIHYTRGEATTPPQFGRLSRGEFEKLLRWMVEQDATDLHITPAFPPTLRVDNVFQPSQSRALAPDEIEQLILSILGAGERAILERDQAVDLSYDVAGLGRFRINVFRQLHGLSAAVRSIRGAVDSFEELHLPNELNWLIAQETGLVLFTGPTGSGKSTTMAALIERLNQTRQLHILTLEAPIEYLFKNQRCLIQQREVGTHTDGFERGLRDALRENPDVIMVGELRDYETVQMAISASETGHLILATMHANTTNNALSRLIDVFPDTQKAGARAMIADTLAAVVNLRLLTHASGRGLVPAVEFLKNNHAVATTIRENKLHQMRQILATSMNEGMWPFERYLADLVRRSQVTHETAYRAAPDKKVFEQFIEARRRQRKG